MARVVIVIEDLPDGQVKVVAEPNFLGMMKIDMSGETLTAAHGYGLYALNQIRKRSEELKREDSPILIPKARYTH